MFKKNLLFAMALSAGLAACGTAGDSGSTAALDNNPFMEESTLPYFAPDFTKIKNEHFKPALLEGMRQQEEAIQAIIDNTEEANFENTILAIEKSSAVLDRSAAVFYALIGAHRNDELLEIQEFIAPKFSEHSDGIYLNDALFQKVKTVYENRDNLGLDDESLKLLEEYYTDFEIAGANLDDDAKEKLKGINAQIASLTTQFTKENADAMNNGAIYVDTPEELAGLSESDIANLKDGDKYKIPLLNTTQQPYLSSLEHRPTREKLFKSSFNRADGTSNDTKDLVIEIAKLRAEKAAILGFDDYASWSLQKTMANNTKQVKDFFAGLIPAAIQKSKDEAAEIQQMIYDSGEDFTLEAWDWEFYAEKVRQAKYDLDESELKPYFELYSVLENGVFYAATQLYGITFEKRTDIPTYHEDVVVYELFEEDGSQLGLFYGDFFARETKRGGAWMSSFVKQSRMYNYKPVIYNVCNYTKPNAGEAALLSYDEATTLFHEFGHALHGFFADQQYPSLSGTSVARDFVEFPSQFNESWALYPSILENYAKHYETGEVIPSELVQKIKNAGTFNQGYSIVENLASANLDMQWHTIGTDVNIADANEFEKQALNRTGLDANPAVPPRYRSTYFAHIFSGGYAAGYYSYLWTEMLSLDAYEWFKENGGLTRENGQRYRDMIISRGNTLVYKDMYKAFRGSDPQIKPLLKARGLAN